MAAEFRMEDIKDIREQTILKIQELSLEPSNSGINFQVFYSFYSNDLLLESLKYWSNVYQDFKSEFKHFDIKKISNYLFTVVGDNINIMKTTF